MILLLDFNCTVSCSHLSHFLWNMDLFKKGWGYLFTDILFPEQIAKQFKSRLQLLKQYKVWKNKDLNGLIRKGIIKTYEPLDQEAIRNIIFCGETRINLLLEFFEILKTQQIQIGISSKQDFYEIKLALDIAGLTPYISFMLTIDNTNTKYELTESMTTPSKNKKYDNISDFIWEKLKEPNITNEFIYVDDNPQIGNQISQEANKLPAGKIAKFYYIGGGRDLPPNNSTGINSNIINQILTKFNLTPITQAGGDPYYQKYLKYKTKYLNLISK